METIADEPRFVIYGLHAEDGIIRYIGKTRNGARRRLASHRSDAKTKSSSTRRSTRWVNKNFDRVQITVLEARELESMLSERERFWIKHYRDLGFDLTNHSDGGEGRSGHVPTAEERERTSRQFKGVPKRPDSIARRTATRKANGYSMHPDSIAKGAEKQRRMWLNNPSMAEKMSRIQKDRLLAGGGHWMKLNPDIVRLVRARWDLGETKTSLAREYGVNFKTIDAVVKRITWKEIE